MKAETLGMIGMLVVVVILGIWLGYARYVECREHGFSVFYCVTQR